jgi:hypothetical protein
MVRGLETFKKYFVPFADNYIIIGGTACDMIIKEAGFTPRATKDIDMILVVEALSSDFVMQFWTFIEKGNYELKQKSEDDRKYYRFINPENIEFPYQIELFSRNPDLLDLDVGTHLTPIPVNDDLTSLSAILLKDEYYDYLTGHSTNDDDLRRANIEALICLKAKAYLDIANRIKAGSREDSKKLRKHRGDVFRLAVMLVEEDVYYLPDRIKTDMQEFSNSIKDDLPDKAIFKEMGLGNIDPEDVYHQILVSFQLDGQL